MPSLRAEQSFAIQEIYSANKLLLADVGAGKTATALRSLRLRECITGPARTLVIGTKRICDEVWGPEVATWAPERVYASVAGLPIKKRQAILTDPRYSIVGLNFENLEWACKTYGTELAAMFPQLIIDESSKLENPAAKSFRAIKPILPFFSWRLPMTASPQANFAADLWGSVYLADLGTSLGKSKTAFLQNFFHPVQRKVGISWIPKAGALDEINRRTAGIVHRMPFKWHEPVEIDVVIPCNMHVKWVMQDIDEALGKGDLEVTIDNITYARNGARVHGKMLQLSAGFIYDDDHRGQFLHFDKLFALKEIVDEARGEPIMVVYQFDHERDAILEQFPQARLLTSDGALKAWNNKEIEMLLVHPKSCGHGLNAQFSGCDLQVWFTPTPDAELYGQTIGRLNRPGNEKTIRIMRLIMQGTKDRATYNVVAARQKGEDATLSMYE